MNDLVRQRIVSTAKALSGFDSIAVAGGPLTGKSLFAHSLDKRPWIETDTFKDLPWADQPAAIIAACAHHARFVVSGVQVGRVLRKGLAIDAVVWLTTALQPLTHDQETMRKGCLTIFEDWMKAPTATYVII